MRIEGLKILDSNYYQQITLSDRVLVVQRLDNSSDKLATSLEDSSCKMTNGSISGCIKNKDDDVVVSTVVDYFLDYARIVSVLKNRELDGKLYDVVDSVEGRKLRFSSSLGKTVKDKIWGKYKFDRNEFLAKLEGYSQFDFTFDPNLAYYSVGEDDSDYEKERIKFCLAADCDNQGNLSVRSDELEFFRRAVDVIMGNNLMITDSNCFINDLGFYDYEYFAQDEMEDRRINVPKILFPVLQSVSSSHNNRVWEERRREESIDGKVYQMKMEEF